VIGYGASLGRLVRAFFAIDSNFLDVNSLFWLGVTKGRLSLQFQSRDAKSLTNE
jgi:hypothetical protein